MIQVVTMGLAEAYRTGLIGPAFPELPSSDVAPGGRFDPLVRVCMCREKEENTFLTNWF